MFILILSTPLQFDSPPKPAEIASQSATNAKDYFSPYMCCPTWGFSTVLSSDNPLTRHRLFNYSIQLQSIASSFANLMCIILYFLFIFNNKKQMYYYK